MGLEFGSPWLVAVVNEGTELRLSHKDNFTGAGFERIRRAVRERPGACAAASGKEESLATHPDGTLFDPLAKTEGHSFGTSSRAVEPGTGHQSEDSCELAQARDGRGHEDRPDGTALCGADQGRGGDGCGLPRPALLPLDDCLYALQPSIPHLPHLRAVLTVQAHRRPLACRMPPASRHSCALAPAAIPSMLCA